jgi:heme/copper-type cytochrome/quinol oxidase subunit 4
MAIVESIKRGRNWREIISLVFGPLSLLLFVIGVFWHSQQDLSGGAFLLRMMVFAVIFSVVSIAAGLGSLEQARKRSLKERTSIFVSFYIGGVVLVSVYLVWALSLYS